MAKVDPKELKRFGDALARPSIRKSFEHDPLGALEKAGVDTSKVPEEVIDLFADLSPEELEVVSRIANKAKGIPGLEELADHNGIIVH